MKPEQLSAQLLRTYWDYSLPVDLAPVLAGLGVDLVYTQDLGDADKSVSGRIDEINGVRRITVRAGEKDTELRKRFTAAHLLWHGLHGRFGWRVNSRSFDVCDTGRESQEANDFAMCLLVPQAALDALMREKGVKDKRKLAEMFGVSEATIAERIGRYA